MSARADVLVFSCNYEVIALVKWKRAMKLVLKGRAESVKDTDVLVRPGMFLPLAIRLLKNIRALNTHKMQWKRHALYVRDLGTCAYCGEKISEKDMTVDHVYPRSRWRSEGRKGSPDTWENTVCSCKECNHRKDDRTPEEANMVLKFRPFAPSVVEYWARKIKMMGYDIDLSELFGA